MTPEHASGLDARLLHTLQGLLRLSSLPLVKALTESGTALQKAMGVDKIDIFLYQPAIETMVAFGISDSPMGNRQQALGLDRQPLANGGTIARVFQTGVPYQNGHLENDPDELPGVVGALGVRSQLVVALEVRDERVGVISAQSATHDFFVEGDLDFLQAASHWVGLLMGKLQMTEDLAHQAAEQERRVRADDLITFLAHDLGNAIAPLRLRFEAVGVRASKAGREDDAHDMLVASQLVERLQHMVRELLDVGRLEAGLFVVRLHALDLGVLAQELADTLGTKLVPVTVQGASSALVQADRFLLRHVLENVIGNAVKHSPPGGRVQLEIGSRDEADGVRCTVDISDQGPGILPELRGLLFERFQGSGEDKGLGLGLYLAQQLTQLQGGTLELDTTYQEGARFRLSLPVSHERVAS